MKQVETRAGFLGRFFSEDYTKRGAILGNVPSYLARQLVQRCQKPTTIIDLGCGYGRDSFFYAYHGHKVLAIDPSFEGLRIAKDMYSEEDDGNVSFIQGTIGSLRTERLASSIGAVVCNRGLHMMNDHDLEEFEFVASKVLRPGGFLLVSGTSPEDCNPKKTRWVPGKENRQALDKIIPDFIHYYVEPKHLIALFSRRFTIHEAGVMKNRRNDGLDLKKTAYLIAQRNLTR